MSETDTFNSIEQLAEREDHLANTSDFNFEFDDTRLNPPTPSAPPLQIDEQVDTSQELEISNTREETASPDFIRINGETCRSPNFVVDPMPAIPPVRRDFIPCEYCEVLVDIEEYEFHMNTCISHINILSVPHDVDVPPDLVMIPCQFCQQCYSIPLIDTHQNQCGRMGTSPNTQRIGRQENVLRRYDFPETWSLVSTENTAKYPLMVDSPEYQMVAAKFLATLPKEILLIERIENQRWYRQYNAHREYFIEKYGRSTEEDMFHGCPADSVESIVQNCFDRSYADRCAFGRGIYFASAAAISERYTRPDGANQRFMFLAKVLVGTKVPGNPSMRTCPVGADSTGTDGVCVTYHDAQAYGQYLITFT